MTDFEPDSLVLAGQASPPRRALRRLVDNVRFVAADVVRCRHILRTLTIIECRQKYAGSVLGSLWYPLYALMLLGSYCFIYLVVFRVKYQEFSTYSFVLFIFAGLVPYLGFSESVTSSLQSVRANLAILSNSVFPIELVPVKHVLAAFVPLLCSLAVLVAMILPTSHLGWHLLYLPVPLLALFLLSAAVGWVLSALAVVIPDVAHLANVALLLLMFVSPIGYSVDMVPPAARPLVYLNPMTYFIEPFRYALLGIRTMPLWTDAIVVVLSAAGACVVAALFKQLAPMFVDYE